MRLPLLLPCMVLAGAAQAAVPLPDALAHCRALGEDAARLTCYDSLTAQPPDPTAPPAERAAQAASAPTTGEVQNSTDTATIPAEPVVAWRTPLTRLWDLDTSDKRGTFTLRAYRPNYVLPVWQNFNPSNRAQSPSQPQTPLFDAVQNTEAKFQISFKTKLWQDMFDTPADLWFGYTQQSHWQVYNKSQSSPFRNTDYEPELMLTVPTSQSLWGWKLAMVGGGLVHQSNGQDDPLSRSWNRIYAMAGLERGPWTVLGRAWYRLPEGGGGDNPDITDYMGHGDVQLIYSRDGSHTFSALGRLNAATGKGMLQLEYSFPIHGRLRGFVQYVNGYGESLIDYNHANSSLGIGLMLTDWLEM